MIGLVDVFLYWFLPFETSVGLGLIGGVCYLLPSICWIDLYKYLGNAFVIRGSSLHNHCLGD